jgi:hypothetical protein
VSKLRIATLVFGLATPSMLSAGSSPAPTNVTMTVDKESPPTPTPPPGDNIAGQLTFDSSYLLDSSDAASHGFPTVSSSSMVKEDIHVLIHLRLHRNNGQGQQLFVDDGSTWELTGSGSGTASSCAGDVHDVAYRFTYSGRGTMTLPTTALIRLDPADEGKGDIALTFRGEANQVREPKFDILGHQHIDYAEPAAGLCGFAAPAESQRRVAWSTIAIPITRTPDGMCKVSETITMTASGTSKTVGSRTVSGTFSCPST